MKPRMLTNHNKGIFMKIQAHIIILLSSVMLLAGCSSKPEDPTPAIEATNKQFVENFLAGDEKAIAELYTEDAKIVAPGTPIVSGRGEIAKFWRGFMDTGVKDVTLKTLHASGSEDLAYEDGVATVLGKDGSPSGVRYVVVWKRVDGKWYLHRDIWNEGK